MCLTGINHNKAVEDIAEYIRSSWEVPDIGVVHWDGKLVSSLQNKNEKQERLPILLSGMLRVLYFI